MDERPSRSSDRPSRAGGLFASAGGQTMGGAALVLVAVLVGVILLNVVDKEPSSDGAASKGSTTSTTAVTDTSSTTAAAPPKTPAELKLIVLNDGGPGGSAGALSDTLKNAGYTNQSPADNDVSDTKESTGLTALCRKGLDREAQALATAVGNGAKAKVGFPKPPPSKTDDRDCAVIVGA
jgi:hypothetical protein